MAFLKWLWSWTSFNFEKIPILGSLLAWLREHDMDFGIPLTAICVFLIYVVYTISDTLFGSSISFFFTLAPIWFPLLAIELFHFRWMDYVRKKFYLRNGRVQYRIKLPQEVQKSPQVMEFVLNQVWNVQNPDNYWQTYIDGKSPQPVALEIASIGGEIRFYANLNAKKAKEAFVPAMYSVYPGVELIEEPVDYAAEIPVGDPDWHVWVVHIGKKEKPDKWGPIKTYIDYELDKMPKEEEKADPLVPILEFMSSIEPTERMYVQLVLKALRPPSFMKGDLVLGEGPKWYKPAQAHVDEIMQRDPETKAPITREGSDFDGMPRITPSERDTVEAIERNIEKYAFGVGIRYMFITKAGKFRSTMVNPTNRMFSQFDVVGRSTLGARWRTDFDFMWFSDPFGDRLELLRKVEHKHYKLRKYANENQRDHPSIMTVEEIATMWHLPGRVALTPTLDRIPSTKSQAPANLPVGELPPTNLPT